MQYVKLGQNDSVPTVKVEQESELSARHAVALGAHDAISTMTKYAIVAVFAGALLYIFVGEKRIVKKLEEL